MKYFFIICLHLKKTYFIDDGYIGAAQYLALLAYPSKKEYSEMIKWEGLQQIGVIQHDRQIGNKATTEVHYYIMSQQLSAAEMLDIARKHWEVENKLHWSLDVGFGEDQNQTTNHCAIENLSILNRLALNIHTQDTETNDSIKLKRLAAGWDNEKLEQLLSTIVDI